MKFQPKFDNQFFSDSLQERLRLAPGELAGDAATPPAAEFASGLLVGGPLWGPLPGPEIDPDISVAMPHGEDSPQMPEPGPWLADLLQQRKEMKS